MKNFVQGPDSFDFTAPVGGVVSGTALLIGKLLVVPVTSADAGDKFTGSIEGIFTLPATSADTPSAGALAYWDATPGEVTTTASGNVLCGYFMEAKSAGVTEAKVKLQAAVS